MLLHSNGPMHRLEGNEPAIHYQNMDREKTAETHLSGRTLRGEIRMERGPCTSEAINQNVADILNQNGKLTATSSPKQRLIDKILARSKVEQFVKEEEHHAQNRKLEEVKESLKKELFKHQLQKSHLEGEFIIPSRMHDHPDALEARIVEIRNNLPAMEDQIQKLRFRVSKDHDKKVISHSEDSVHEGAEPYQIRNINMVQSILNDMVEKLMDDYIQKVPDGMDSFSADNLATKNMQETTRLMKEVKTNRITSLVTEQVVLEVTYELSNEAAEEIYSVNQMSRSLAFDVIFNAVQGKQNQDQKPNEHLKHTCSSDHLVTLLLEQQKDRELHSYSKGSLNPKEKIGMKLKTVKSAVTFPCHCVRQFWDLNLGSPSPLAPLGFMPGGPLQFNKVALVENKEWGINVVVARNDLIPQERFMGVKL